MTRENLLAEIYAAEEELEAEKALNGGHEGSTLSYGLRTKIEAFKDLLVKYYS